MEIESELGPQRHDGPVGNPRVSTLTMREDIVKMKGFLGKTQRSGLSQQRVCLGVVVAHQGRVPREHDLKCSLRTGRAL